MDTPETKRCSKCGDDKPVDSFPFKNRAKNKRHSYCHGCFSTYHHGWYEKHTEQTKRAAAISRLAYRKRAVDFLRGYLWLHPCVDCGFTDVRALDFDHVRGKKSFTITYMLRRMMSLDRIADEIKKCEVRCRNCHAIRTNSVNGSWRNKKRPVSIV